MSAVRHLERPLLEGYAQQPKNDYLQEKSTSVDRPGRTMLLIALCAALLAAMALGYVSQKVLVMKLSYNLASIEGELAALERENGFLQIQVAAARSPERLEKLARQRLAMVEPQKTEYLVLSTPALEKAAPEVGAPNSRDPGLLRVLSAWVHDHWPTGSAAAAGAQP